MNTNIKYAMRTRFDRVTKTEPDTQELPQAQEARAKRNVIKKRRAKNKVARASRKRNR